MLDSKFHRIRNGGANARFKGIFLHRRPDFIFEFLEFEVIMRFFSVEMVIGQQLIRDWK